MAPSSRVPTPSPPEKGSFPLDHDGRCRPPMTEYLTCLRANRHDYAVCKPLAKLYLQCRIDSGLMAPEDLAALGFANGQNQKHPVE